MKRFYFKHIEAVLILGSLFILGLFALSFLYAASLSYPIVTLIAVVLIFFAANKITKRNRL